MTARDVWIQKWRDTTSYLDSLPKRNTLPHQSRVGQPSARLSDDKLETILNRQIPADRRIFKYAAWGIVLLALIHLCWLQLQRRSEAHVFYAIVTKSTVGHAAKMHFEELDQIAGRMSNGNVLLKLADFAKTNPVGSNSLGNFYFRTCYTLYPRRLYAASSDKVINDGSEIIRIGFSPTPKWLQERDVRYALTFGNNSVVGKMPQLEILQPRERESGMQTNKPGGN